MTPRQLYCYICEEQIRAAGLKFKERKPERAVTQIPWQRPGFVVSVCTEHARNPKAVLR